jgi:hypothetical protein
MEYNISQGNGPGYALGVGNTSYGVPKINVIYSGGGLGNSVNYSDRNINVQMNDSPRCPGGCMVCKGACRT